MTNLGQPRKRRRRGRYIAALLLALLIVDVVWVQWDRRITIGPDTTRITAPIVGGYPDYLAAMNIRHSQGVTPENNAASAIVAIVGLQGTPETWRHAVYTQWAIPEPAGNPLFQDFPAWMKEHGETPPPVADLHPWESSFDKEPDNAIHGPWSAGEHVRLAQWLTEMAPALTVLDESCRRPIFYFPFVLEDGRVSAPVDSAMYPWTIPLARKFRALSRAAVLRAMLRLHDGNTAGFRQDILLAMRMARLLAQQPVLIDHLVALAIDDSALVAVQRAAAQPLDAPTAETLRREIDALPPLSSPAYAIDQAERYMALSATCALHQESAKKSVFNLLPVSYDAALRRVNEVFARIVQAYSLPTEPERRNALDRLTKEVDAQFSNAGTLHRLTHMEELLLAIFLPSLTRADRLQTSNLVDRDLALTALALRQAQSRDGTFPNTLADLKISEFAPPPDRFLEKPLIYQRKADGYVLYSVGPDLEDNGGTPRPQTATGKKWDVVVTTDH